MPPVALHNYPTLYFALPSPAGSQCGYATQEVLPRGLCTPPADENSAKMGTRFEVPPLATSENYHFRHHPSAFAPTMPPSDRRRPVLSQHAAPNGEMVNLTLRYPAPLPEQSQPKPTTEVRPYAQPTAQQQPMWPTAGPEYSQPHYDTRPPAPTSTPTGSERNTAAAAMTMHSLSIPARISPNGGDLAEFMAEAAALFWFETPKVLEQVEKMQNPASGTSILPLAPSAVASPHYKKWVSTVLSTTQITQNVAILALLYIYRLKMANPTVKGRPGSEFRLLTVAVMLGNKFLDDNTYTNKTWADVSAISVNEIHVMEVEFLSNMRYSLLVSPSEWEQWLDKLARFWSYLQLAQQAPSPSPSPLLIPSPTDRSFAWSLPSPNHSLPSLPLPAQPTTDSFSRQSPPRHVSPVGYGCTQSWLASYSVSNATSPLALKPAPHQHRKRSFPDEDLSEPPPKRVGRVPVGQGNLVAQLPTQHLPATSLAQLGPSQPTTVHPIQSRLTPAVASEVGRRSIPSLTVNTAQAAATAPITQPQPYGAATYAPPHASALSLPPLVPGVRAMSTVYPTVTHPSSHSTPSACGVVTPTTGFPPMSYGTPTKRLSPQNVLGPYPGSSPLTMATPMGTASGLHTPISHSPSIYLQERNSPYRPVRHVNALLYPPPSAFLQQYHLPNPILPNQMQYQPLGKRHEYRTGILPEFLPSSHRPGPGVSGQHPAAVAAPYPLVPSLQPVSQHERAPYPPRGQGPSYPSQY